MLPSKVIREPKMKEIIMLILLFFTALLCKAQPPTDPSRGVKIYALVTKINEKKPVHYGSFEEMKELDFNTIHYVSIENRGNKTSMDTLLLHNLLNNAPNLTSLTVGRNIYLDHFPKIEKNNHLKELYLIGNNLLKIPADIDNLIALDFFECTGNKIETVPDSFSNLKNIKTLILKGNNIKIFPEEILKLQNLNVLWVGGKIKSIPENIDDLSQLEKVAFTNTDVSTLPKSFSRLKNLKHIDLSNNQFTVFPSPLLKLKQVKMLSLNENPITKTALEKSLKGIKLENATIYIPLREEEFSEIKKTYSKINFISEMVLADTK